MDLYFLDLVINKVPFVPVNINIITQMYYNSITKTCISVYCLIENETQPDKFAKVGVRRTQREGG